MKIFSCDNRQTILLKVLLALIICVHFICNFAYIQLSIGHFSCTYLLLYSHPQSFYMHIHYMGAYFFGPYPFHIMRDNCIGLEQGWATLLASRPTLETNQVSPGQDMSVQTGFKTVSTIKQLLSGCLTCFYSLIAIQKTSNVARGPYKSAWRAICGPRAGRCPGLVKSKHCWFNAARFTLFKPDYHLKL